MIDHVTIRVDDLEQSRRFYALALELLGAPEPAVREDFVEWNDFSLAPASRERRSTSQLRVALQAPSREAVGTWWGAMTAAGYADHGASGARPEYAPTNDRAFVTDPDGSSVEAVHIRGFESLGAPGERPEYHAGYFAAYLSNVEPVFHDR